MLQSLRILAPTIIFVVAHIYTTAQHLSLKIAGNDSLGYFVQTLHNNQVLLSNKEELSLQLFNLDLSACINIPYWTGQSWRGDDTQITLKRQLYLKELDANLDILVQYEVMNNNLIKKTIKLFQPSMPSLFYILKQTAIPADKPQRYVSFEYDSFPGGFVHEMYPAAGFITPDNFVVGLLLDAGYKDQYTRNTRRRFSGRGGGFVGMRKLPDPELIKIASRTEQNKNQHYIRQTWGEMYNLDAGDTTVLSMPTKFTKENASVAVVNNTINMKGLQTGRTGINFIAPLQGQQVYTISFSCKGNKPLSLKLFRIKNGQQTVELELGVKYIDQFPTHDKEWSCFEGSILVPYIGHDSVSMFIGSQSGKDCNLQIKDLKFIAHQPKSEPYNFLAQGDTAIKTSFIFVEPWQSHQQFMISAQARLAEGKGFRGSQIEKMLYANLNMLTWITDVNDVAPFNVPNMNYAPDMYNRDCFFSIVSSYNKHLNISLWEQWGKTQTAEGGIGTIITPQMGSVETKGNEATIEWLIWALLNKRRFGAALPREKLQKAVDYVLNEFDSTGTGICYAHFPLCQIDIVDFYPKTSRLAVNQGMLAIVLRTIKELGFPIAESRIAHAEQAYRNFYDTNRKHLLFDRDYPDLISLTDLEPEFYALWLFNRPILTDVMVVNHLEQIPQLNKVPNAPHPQFGTTAPLLVHLTKDKKGYSYLTKNYQPFGQFGVDNYSDGKNDGYYYNGGSWLRAEYCAYVAGLKHGWKRAAAQMENRIWAEMYLNPSWPFSKEFIPTKWTTTDSWWPSTKGLCWNVFILMANEVAGWRTPDMDPDYNHEAL